MTQQTTTFRRAPGDNSAADGASPAARRVWVPPMLHRMEAISAENGIDPIIPDGPLSFGS